MSEVLLASNSPRRRALLAALGVAFAVEAVEVDETPLADEPPAALVCRLCRAKAAAVALRRPDAVVLAADTTVSLDGVLLGKPVDALEAAAMLRMLAGRQHQVHTGLCVARAREAVVRLSISDVTMRSYDDGEIARYVATGDPLDKAGAYAIQHPQFAPVAAWSGCYTGIMGLPLRLAAGMLAQAGVAVPGNVAAVCSALSGQGCCAEQAEQHV